MTWACLGYVQGLANIFGPQNRTQGHCGWQINVCFDVDGSLHCIDNGDVVMLPNSKHLYHFHSRLLLTLHKGSL